MLKNFFSLARKNFSNSNQNKFEEAKKRAMEMYEKIQNQEKLIKNKKTEEEFLKNRREEADKINFDVSDYKKENVKHQIENFLENLNVVEQRKKKSVGEEGLNLNYYNKIHEDVVYYKLNQNDKNKIDKEKWVNIYEAKFDPSYENFLNLLNKLLKILLAYGTFLLLKKIYKIKNPKSENNPNNPKNSQVSSFTKMEIFSWSLFYFFTIWMFLINRGFIKRTVYKLSVKEDKIRIYLHNSNKKEQNKTFKQTEISKLFSITSKSKNLHEILYHGDHNQVFQMFANKNAFYDKHLLFNLCHPKVKAIKFTNLDKF